MWFRFYNCIIRYLIKWLLILYIEDGTLWSWGRHQNGMLGIGSLGGNGQRRDSPVQVKNTGSLQLEIVKKLSVGGEHVLVLTGK